MTQLKPLYQPKPEPMKLAIFISGSGTNAQRIIDKYIDDRDKGVVAFEPILMFTDNPESRARHLAKEQYKDKGVELLYFPNSIQDFYRSVHCKDMRNMEARALYDLKQQSLLTDLGIDTVALAGYEWLVTEAIFNNFTTLNVHPGDKRLKFPGTNLPMLGGLGWVPSAKAIYIGENQVRSTVFLVDEGLDTGANLSISAPQQLHEDILGMPLEDRIKLLGDALKLVNATPIPGDLNSLNPFIRAISKYIREHSELIDEEIAAKFPIVGYGKEGQNRLKEHGDWVIYPRTIDGLARGDFARDGNGLIHYKGVPKPNGIIFDLNGNVVG